LTILSFLLVRSFRVPWFGSSMPSRQVSHVSPFPLPLSFRLASRSIPYKNFLQGRNASRFALLRSLPLFCQISLALSGFPCGLPFRTFFRACLAPS